MSVCAQKVRIVLAEKRLDWKDNHMNLFKGESRTDKYKELNPKGVVPTLISENGEIIIESTVITEYLDEAFPAPPLKPANPYSVALMRLWTKQVDEGIHISTTAVSNGIAFRYAHLDGKTDIEIKEHFDRIPDASRREMLWDLTNKGIESKYFSTSIHRFKKLFDDMDAVLKENKWLAGDDYSLADIALTPYITRIAHLHLLGLLDRRVNLLRWYDNVRERDSYKVAIQERLEQHIVNLMAEKGRECFDKVKKLLEIA